MAQVKRPVIWTDDARQDLAEIVAYISDRNPLAAERLQSVIEDAALPLLEHPYLFRKGRVAGTREIVAHPNYILIYRVQNDVVIITSVIHARRQYP